MCKLINKAEYFVSIKTVSVGKKLPMDTYVHKDALHLLPDNLQDLISTIDGQLLENKDWNLVKLSRKNFKISFLSYPNFFDYAYPALSKSYSVNLGIADCMVRDYSKSNNPPILHRKETFLPPDHPSVESFKEITAEGKKIGLYVNTRTIGFRAN